MSAWIQHVKAYAKKHGVSYKEAMKGASKTYGSGVNEDRIKANIARRKAVGEKRDDAQAFLSNIAQKAKELPPKNKPSNDYIKRFRFALMIKLVLDEVSIDMDKKRGWVNAKQAYDKAVEKMGSLDPEYKKELEDDFDNERAEMVEYYLSDLGEYDIEGEPSGSESDFSWLSASSKTNKLLREEAKDIMKRYKEEKKRLNL